ncbi:macrophage mannose receptor 1-like [Salarias fasciatus]|uniref:macrophage mannose receptor 1-like n=1 Tax=Salarias fasciatus TaxID=181472 RepID=UPI001176B67D|nr:macrophage mannose receptor 1-like [Salarias fasciatus]
MWTEAQQYCRQFYDDLAAFESQDDIDELDRPSFIGGYAWIGLWDDPEAWNGTMGNGSNSWRWSGAESTSTTGYHYMHIERVDNWEAYEHCMATDDVGRWLDVFCWDTFDFLCYTAQGDQKTYTLIEEKKKWEDAQSYCRINYTDLAMIENEQENKKVLSLITGHKVWIGLYREAWMWSDGSSKSFWKWRTQQPDNANFSQSCVAEYPDHDWDDRPCQSEIPFICQGAPKVKQRTVVKLTIQTLANLSDPETHAQLLKQMEAHLQDKISLTDLKLMLHVVHMFKKASVDP